MLKGDHSLWEGDHKNGWVGLQVAFVYLYLYNKKMYISFTYQPQSWLLRNMARCLKFTSVKETFDLSSFQLNLDSSLRTKPGRWTAPLHISPSQQCREQADITPVLFISLHTAEKINKVRCYCFEGNQLIYINRWSQELKNKYNYKVTRSILLYVCSKKVKPLHKAKVLINLSWNFKEKHLLPVAKLGIYSWRLMVVF